MIVSVKGAELYYSTRGQGPTCIVLSSIGTRPYEQQMPAALSDRLRLVYVDPRGAGRSTGEPADLTFDVLADDLEAIRADLGVPRVALGRHDYTVPYVLWESVAPTLPGATVQVFEQSGHQPFFEEPDRFAASLTRWMSDISPRGS
jgi:pimeloyl-ACP methyl ester carboxylesterase